MLQDRPGRNDKQKQEQNLPHLLAKPSECNQITGTKALSCECSYHSLSRKPYHVYSHPLTCMTLHQVCKEGGARFLSSRLRSICFSAMSKSLENAICSPLARSLAARGAFIYDIHSNLGLRLCRQKEINQLISV